jgi:hypothetical protein
MAKFIVISRADYDCVMSRHEDAAVVLQDVARTCDRGIRIRLRAFHDARREHGDSVLPPSLLDELRSVKIVTAARAHTPVAKSGHCPGGPGAIGLGDPPVSSAIGAEPRMTDQTLMTTQPRVSVAPVTEAGHERAVVLEAAVSKPFSWVAAEAAVVGAAHLRLVPPKPCQDAALADEVGRPLVVVADGAGSAALSHLGASCVVTAVRRLVRTLDADFAMALDAGEPTFEIGEGLAGKIVAHAAGTLDDLAMTHQRPTEDFRCTLLVWVLGTERSVWVKVGDGALVAQREGGLRCVGPIGKGEYANQTCFVGPGLVREQWCWGSISTATIEGVAAMSDGAADRLVSSNGENVAQAMGKLLHAVGTGRADRRHVFGLLADGSMWKGSSGDDKSIALLARNETFNG